MLDKVDYKGAVYYCFRYFGWSYLFGFLLGFVTGFLLGFVSGILTSILTKFEGLQSFIFTIISVLLIIAVDFCFHKVILNKVFFKKYKRIVVRPRFKNVTWGFNAKTYLKLMVASLLASSLIAAIYFMSFPDIFSAMRGDDPVTAANEFFMFFIVHWTIWPATFIFSIAVRFALLKRIVSKNAEVMIKVRCES